MRLAPRSTWAIALIPANAAAMKPATSAVSPDSRDAAVEPWRRASVRISPTAPGASSSIVSLHRAGERLLVEDGGQADDRDQRGQDGQRDLEGERARVAEAVGGAEAGDRVGQEPAATDLPEGLEGLIALELAVGPRDVGGRRHAAA